MTQRAHVSSTEAIATFRSNLIVYVSKARPAVEEVGADVMRVRLWLENEQRGHWERELRRRRRELEQAQAELFSARMSPFQKETASQQMMMHRAKRAVDEAEGKLRLIRHWARNFDNRVQPLLKQTEKVHTVLSNDLTKAIADLAQILNTLAAYAEVGGNRVGTALSVPAVPPATAPSAEAASAASTVAVPTGGNGDSQAKP